MVLERIRGLAGVAVGWAASHLGVMHTATSTDVDQSYVHNLLPGQCAETVGAIALLREVLATAEFDVPAMRISAGQHWSTASALADALVSLCGLSFRDAHESVARLVEAHERADCRDGELRGKLIKDAFRHVLSESDVRSILDPESFVESRISSGGTSPKARRELAVAASADLAEKKKSLLARIDYVDKGLQLLLKDAQSLVISPE
ncbi:hypothetical protein BN1723_009869, partial [Verticillium longisporum]